MEQLNPAFVKYLEACGWSLVYQFRRPAETWRKGQLLLGFWPDTPSGPGLYFYRFKYSMEKEPLKQHASFSGLDHLDLPAFALLLHLAGWQPLAEGLQEAQGLEGLESGISELTKQIAAGMAPASPEPPAP